MKQHQFDHIVAMLWLVIYAVLAMDGVRAIELIPLLFATGHLVKSFKDTIKDV